MSGLFEEISVIGMFITRFENLHPVLYWLIAIVFFALMLVYCYSVRNTYRNGPFILLLLFSAIEAFWVYVFKHPSIIALVISTFVVLLIVSLFYYFCDPLFNKAGLAKNNKKAIRLLKARRFKDAANLGVDDKVLSQLRNRTIVDELAEYEAQLEYNDGWVFPLAKYGLKADMRKKIILHGKNDTLRIALFERYGEWYGNQDLLIKLAPDCSRARDLLKENIGKIKEPDKLHRAIELIGGLKSSGLINAVLPNLNYPEFREELLSIATSVKTVPEHTRTKALDMIPSRDKAYKERYCPYCGSTDVDTKWQYQGLYMDMFFYGYKCHNCGHKDASPEGMGEPKRFDVSLVELCGRK